jgi:lipopolysaccharide transport system ATP-binding protein
LTITAKANELISRPILGFLVRDKLGQDLFGENSLRVTSLETIPVQKGQAISCSFEFTLPMLPNGQYSVVATFADGDLVNNVQHHWLNEALILSVSSSNVRWGLVGAQFHNVNLRILSDEL